MSNAFEKSKNIPMTHSLLFGPHIEKYIPQRGNKSHKICCALLGLAYTFPYHEPVYTGRSSVHLNATGMPRLTQCTLGYHWATQRILAGYMGTPLEKLSWNSPTLECHWRNLVATAPHWDATGETFNFCSLHWNTTGWTVTAHTCPDTYS